MCNVTCRFWTRAWFAVGLMAAGMGSAFAADQPGASQAPAFGPGAQIWPGAGALGGSAERVSDVDAQLRDIETTKKLMKALGELHGQAAPGALLTGQNQLGAGGKPGIAQTVPAAALADPSANTALELPRLPAEQLRAATGAVSQVARTIGVTSSSSDGAGRAADSGLGRIEESSTARSRAPGDDEKFRALFDQLVDEMLPWAIGFVVLFGAGYGVFALVLARSGSSGRERYSERGGDQPQRRRRRGADLRRAPEYRAGRSSRHSVK